ncbi:uncharacterized protein LOC141726592 [Zonotrichia albicollis]|uniref:uncharacterized protein LOC141726592 n=1 Tax=Zonotrichia albicollis TaxID=44394 RepID=UPI003D811DC3
MLFLALAPVLPLGCRAGAGESSPGHGDPGDLPWVSFALSLSLPFSLSAPLPGPRCHPGLGTPTVWEPPRQFRPGASPLLAANLCPLLQHRPGHLHGSVPAAAPETPPLVGSAQTPPSLDSPKLGVPRSTQWTVIGVDLPQDLQNLTKDRTRLDDEVAGKASPLDWLDKVLKPLEPPAGASAGRTFAAPFLVPARNPSADRRGPPRRKNKPRGETTSLESNNVLKRIVEELHKGNEMDIEVLWKAAFPEGSSRSLLPAPATGKEEMPDTGTGTEDWDTGKASPLTWRFEIVKPTGGSAVTDVTAGTTSPTPGLDNEHQTSSHHRDPPTVKPKHTTARKFQKPFEVMWQLLKEELQGGQEVDAEAVLKAAFPTGSRDSVPASAAGREAMPGTATGDELARKISPLDWLNKVLKPLEPPADVSAGRTFPVPLLVPSRKPGSHRSGPLRGKDKATGHKKAHEPNNMVMELHKGNGMDREALWKAAFPAGRRVMPGTATGAEPVGEGDLASQPTFRIEPLGHGEVMEQKAGQKGVFPQASRGRLAAPAAGKEEMPDMGTGKGGAAGTTAHVPDSQKGPGGGFCQGTGFWLGLLAGLLLLELIFILCSVRIWTCWKRKGSTGGQEL